MSTLPEVVESQAPRATIECFAADVGRGLSRQPKSIPSAWFYDERGAQLFQQITKLNDYYLTRCEAEILTRHAGQIAESAGHEPFRLVEAGAGDGQKTEILLRAFLERQLQFEYVPIDICKHSVLELTSSLRRRIGARHLKMRGIVAEYFDALTMLKSQSRVRNVVLFLGSSIGNFSHAQAQQFLRGLRHALRPGDLVLIGFDLKKDPAILQRAYDDPAGITREFNLNLLDRINRELGGHFDRRNFTHHAYYNLAEGAMESWLVSRVAQEVPIERLGRSLTLAAWEGIKVESSYKYDLPQIESFAANCGFKVEQHLTDNRRYFVDSIWQAVEL